MVIGRVTQVMGPVIDVRFEHNEVPKINAATIKIIANQVAIVSPAFFILLNFTKFITLFQELVYSSILISIIKII